VLGLAGMWDVYARGSTSGSGGEGGGGGSELNLWMVRKDDVFFSGCGGGRTNSSKQLVNVDVDGDGDVGGVGSGSFASKTKNVVDEGSEDAGTEEEVRKGKPSVPDILDGYQLGGSFLAPSKRFQELGGVPCPTRLQVLALREAVLGVKRGEYWENVNQSLHQRIESGGSEVRGGASGGMGGNVGEVGLWKVSQMSELDWFKGAIVAWDSLTRRGIKS
jgi:hypothetical protein